MEYRGPGRGPLAVALVLILVLSALGVGTSQGASHTNVVTLATGSPLPMTASPGFKFAPAEFAFPNPSILNTTIDVTFTDGDTIAHTFTIGSRQGWVIPNTYTSGQLAAYFAAYPPMFTINATNPGSYPGNFTAPPAAGWYEFVCNEPGHFQEGMYGFIAFGEPLPANLTVTAPSVGPGTAVFIIVGTIVALTVIAIVLGFVIGRRRGTLHEMPPERLGYPEPAHPAEPAPPPGAPPKRP
jgi:hypothetical protein